MKGDNFAMTDKMTHISKVKISKLWGYSDLNFEWKLNPDVNVLAGDNGSGKSTILKLLLPVILERFRKKMMNILTLAEKVEIYFNNDICASYFMVAGSVKEFEKKNIDYKKLMKELLKRQEEKNSYLIEEIQAVVFSTTKNNIKINSQIKLPTFTIIDTFDQELKEKESIQKLSNDKVKTELDWQIYQLQEQYKDYQINIGKRANEVLKRAITNGAAGLAKAEQEVDKKKNTFLDMIDELFKSTQKKIDREKNEISFIQREKDIISPYQLSSGEKQILVILLSALIQDNKHSVMIMDEPEISLHTDWQKSLIHNIRKLNENAQIIIATHSPFIISKGWASEKYVFQMDRIKLK